MHVCMCVHVCACVCVYACVRARVCVHARVHAHTCACVVCVVTGEIKLNTLRLLSLL